MIFKNNLLPKSLEEYNKLYKQSVDNPEVFWTDVAESFIWKSKWSKVHLQMCGYSYLATMVLWSPT